MILILSLVAVLICDIILIRHIHYAHIPKRLRSLSFIDVYVLTHIRVLFTPHILARESPRLKPAILFLWALYICTLIALGLLWAR